MQPQHNHKRPIAGSYLVQQTSLSSSEDECDGEFDHLIFFICPISYACIWRKKHLSWNMISLFNQREKKNKLAKHDIYNRNELRLVE